VRGEKPWGQGCSKRKRERGNFSELRTIKPIKEIITFNAYIQRMSNHLNVGEASFRKSRARGVRGTKNLVVLEKRGNWKHSPKSKLFSWMVPRDTRQPSLGRKKRKKTTSMNLNSRAGKRKAISLRSQKPYQASRIWSKMRERDCYSSEEKTAASTRKFDWLGRHPL